MRRNLSIKMVTGFLSFSMLLGAAHQRPVTVHGANTEYAVWINKVQITDANAANVLSGDQKNDGKVRYNPDTNTLTLENVDINHETDSGNTNRNQRALNIEQELTIELIGENKITVSASGSSAKSYSPYGILSTNGLTIKGPGSLEVVNSVSSKSNIYAISVAPLDDSKKLTIQDCEVTAIVTGSTTSTSTNGFCTNAALNADAIDINNAKVTAKGGPGGKQFSYGIQVTNDSDANITITASEVVLESGDGKNTYGIYDNGGISVTDSKINITGGNGTASGSFITGENYGIFCGKNITIKDSQVEAKSGTGHIVNGIFSNGSLIADNSKVTGIGAAAQNHITDDYSSGVYCNGSLTVSNKSELTAQSGDSSGHSTAVYCDNHMEVNDSSVTAVSGTAGNNSYGISAVEFVQNGGTVDAKAGNGTNYSSGLWTNSADISAGTLVAQGGDLEIENVWSEGIYAGKFVQSGGAVAAKAGKSAKGFSVGIELGENGITISSGTLAAASASESGAVFLPDDIMPVYDNYRVTIKAGSSEGEAQIIEEPTADTYWDNTYLCIEPYSCVHVWSTQWSSDASHHWHDCTKNGCTITENADKNGFAEHTYTEGQISVEPTYLADGERIDTCECGAVKKVVLPKLVNSAAPTITVPDAADSSIYCSPVTVIIADADNNLDTVTLNGEAVTLTDGKLTISPSDKIQTVIATDKAGENAALSITVNDGHTWNEGEVKLPATEAQEGSKHFVCIYCGASKDEMIPKLAPTITETVNTGYTQGVKDSMIFKSEAAFEDFIGVLVDGEVLDTNQFTAAKGSTIVTLKPEYLDTLPAGEHLLEMRFTSGTASAPFSITAKNNNTNEDNNTDDKENKNDNTDENDNMNDDNNTQEQVSEHETAAVPATMPASENGSVSDTHSREADDKVGNADSADGQNADSPSTNDAYGTKWWLALLLISGGVLAGTKLCGRKKIF